MLQHHNGALSLLRHRSFTIINVHHRFVYVEVVRVLRVTDYETFRSSSQPCVLFKLKLHACVSRTSRVSQLEAAILHSTPAGMLFNLTDKAAEVTRLVLEVR